MALSHLLHMASELSFHRLLVVLQPQGKSLLLPPCRRPLCGRHVINQLTERVSKLHLMGALSLTKLAQLKLVFLSEAFFRTWDLLCRLGMIFCSAQQGRVHALH